MIMDEHHTSQNVDSLSLSIRARPPRSPRVGDDEFIFAFFPKLPIELKLRIWKHGIPPPRIVKLYVEAADTINDADTQSRAYAYKDMSSTNHVYGLKQFHGRLIFSTDAKAPPLLWACRTSREVILKRYTTCIESARRDRKIRLDGDHDTVFLYNIQPCLLRALPGNIYANDFAKKATTTDSTKIYLEQFRSVKKIALTSLPIIKALKSNSKFGLRFLSYFPTLQSLTLLINSDSSLITAIKRYHEEPEFRNPWDELYWYEEGRHRKLSEFMKETDIIVTEGLQELHDRLGSSWNMPEVQFLYMKAVSGTAALDL